MHTKCSIFHNRKGVSTILGTLIFIGILFSAYIPMTLVMRQADNIYERELHAAKARDELQYDEDLMVYAYSETDDDWITVFVQNNGEEVVKVVRIWLNDGNNAVSETIASSAGLFAFDPIPFTGSEGDSLNVKVTTSNGNVFSCSLGSIRYSAANGWYTPSLGIVVNIVNLSGQYKIEISETNDDFTVFGDYQSSGIEHDDISKTFLIPEDETWFNVLIEKKIGGTWTSLDVISPVQVPSQNGNPVVYVVADGT